MSGPRRAILRSLVTRSGDIVDASGFATADLLSDPEVGGFPPQSVRRAIADLESAGLVEREVNGRRVYRIAVTDEGRQAATERGLIAFGAENGCTHPEALASGDRKVLTAAAAAISNRVTEWAATVDLTLPPDRVRLDFVRHLLSPLAGHVPTASDLALAIVHANALNDALLAAYRTRGPDLDKALVESHLSTAVEVLRLVGAIHQDIYRREGTD